MKLKEKNKAILLRKKGLSYSEIKKRISVSQSTLSMWLRDVSLTEKQKKFLFDTKLVKARQKASAIKISTRITNSSSTIRKAWDNTPALMQNPLFLLGMSLYWAEGSKNSEQVRFSNADPEMIKCIMKWFREVCMIPNEQFRIQLHVHTLHVRPEVEKYWSSVTKIPLNQFIKTYIKPTSLKHRKNILYEGTCMVRVLQSTNLFRQIIGWRLGILEHFDIISSSKVEKNSLIAKMAKQRNGRP